MLPIHSCLDKTTFSSYAWCHAGESGKDAQTKRFVLDCSRLPCSSQLSSFIKNKMSYSLSSCFSAVEKIVSTSLKQLLINIESWWLALELLPKSEIGEYGVAPRTSPPPPSSSPVFYQGRMNNDQMWKREATTITTLDALPQAFHSWRQEQSRMWWCTSSETTIHVHACFHTYSTVFKGKKSWKVGILPVSVNISKNFFWHRAPDSWASKSKLKKVTNGSREGNQCF